MILKKGFFFCSFFFEFSRFSDSSATTIAASSLYVGSRRERKLWGGLVSRPPATDTYRRVSRLLSFLQKFSSFFFITKVTNHFYFADVCRSSCFTLVFNLKTKQNVCKFPSVVSCIKKKKCFFWVVVFCFFSSNGDDNQPSHVIISPSLRLETSDCRRRRLCYLPFFFRFCVCVCVCPHFSSHIRKKRRKNFNSCVPFSFSIRLDAGHDTATAT